MMKKIIQIMVIYVIAFNSNADVTCVGKIVKLHKWNNADRISILLDAATNWIQMPTAADDAMALMAFAADKTVELRWVDSQITSCTQGWVQHMPLKGWWWVLK